jgi:hypothetical protein
VLAASSPRSSQVPQQAGGEGDPLEMLRASLVAAQPRRSPSGQALALLEPPGVLALQRGGAALPAWRRALLWLPGVLGVKPQCFSLAVQLVVAYTLGGWEGEASMGVACGGCWQIIPRTWLCRLGCARPSSPPVPAAVLILVTIPDVNAAFQESLTWTLFVLVSVMEPSTGEPAGQAVQQTRGGGRSGRWRVRRRAGARGCRGGGRGAARAWGSRRLSQPPGPLPLFKMKPLLQAAQSSRACSAWWAPWRRGAWAWRCSTGCALASLWLLGTVLLTLLLPRCIAGCGRRAGGCRGWRFLGVRPSTIALLPQPYHLSLLCTHHTAGVPAQWSVVRGGGGQDGGHGGQPGGAGWRRSGGRCALPALQL